VRHTGLGGRSFHPRHQQISEQRVEGSEVSNRAEVKKDSG